MRLKKMCMAIAAALASHSAQRGLVLGALSLVLEKDAHGKLPKEQQGLYAEKDGKFHLDVEGVEDTSGLKSALEKEREARKTAEKERKEQAKLFEGLDPVEIRKLLERLGGDEEAQLIKAGKIDEVVARRTEKLRQAHERAIEEAGKKIEAAEARGKKFSDRVLDNHVRAAANKAGLHPNAVEDALFRARTLFTLDDEGNAVQLKDGEKVMGKDGRTPFSPSEWVESMREGAPHWFPAGGNGGGSQGGGKGGNAKSMKRADFDKLGVIEKATAVRDKIQIVD